MSATLENIKNCGISSSNVYLMNAESMAFKDKRLNMITCMMSTITHSANYSNILSNIHNALSDKGHFIMSVWEPKSYNEELLSIIPKKTNTILQERYNKLRPINKTLNAHGFLCIDKIYSVIGDDNIYLDLLDKIPKDKCQTTLFRLFEDAIRKMFPYSQGQIGIYLCTKL